MDDQIEADAQAATDSRHVVHEAAFRTARIWGIVGLGFAGLYLLLANFVSSDDTYRSPDVEDQLHVALIVILVIVGVFFVGGILALIGRYRGARVCFIVGGILGMPLGLIMVFAGVKAMKAAAMGMEDAAMDPTWISRSTKFDRAGLAAGAGLLTIISLWSPWYGMSASIGGFSLEGPPLSAWESLDGIDTVILLLSLAAIALAVLTLVPTIKVSVPTSPALMCIGAVVVLLVLFRIVDKPSGPDYLDVGGVKWGIFASLVFGATIAGAGLLKISDRPAA